MIDEAIGKILGMAMAYGVSSLGMLLAYVNYRKRIVKAKRVMTGAAWGVAAAALLATAGGVAIVGWLAASVRTEAHETAAAEVAEPAGHVVTANSIRKAAIGKRADSSWLGYALPGVVFLLATGVTAGLHRRFSAGDDTAGSRDPRTQQSPPNDSMRSM